MRAFRVTSGKFEGDHIIFESLIEFNQSFNSIIPFRWGVDDINTLVADMWVQATDGYIVQCLQVSVLRSHKYKFPRPTWIARFPMGTFSCYQIADGSIKYANFYAQYAKMDKSSMSPRPKTIRSISDLDKIKYATYLTTGVPALKAFRLSFPKLMQRPMSKQKLISKAVILMNDKIVKAEIHTQMETFKSMVDEEFPIDMLLKELKILLRESEPGSGAHRGNLKFIMELKGLIQTEKKNVSNIEDAEIMPEPPQLGIPM